MIYEHDRIVLTADVPEEDLFTGDVGTVVHIWKGGEAYEVEFFTLAGKTVTVATLTGDVVRPVLGSDRLHARAVAA